VKWWPWGKGPYLAKAARKAGRAMEQDKAKLSTDRTADSEKEAVSRRQLLAFSVPALAAASMMGPEKAEAAVPPGGSRLDVILKAG